MLLLIAPARAFDGRYFSRTDRDGRQLFFAWLASLRQVVEQPEKKLGISGLSHYSDVTRIPASAGVMPHPTHSCSCGARLRGARARALVSRWC